MCRAETSSPTVFEDRPRLQQDCSAGRSRFLENRPRGWGTRDMIRNAYKREDVFLCRHDSHEGFQHRVSAYHVLIEKRCHPHGCVEFRWKCKLLGKGGRCPKGYKHVGNNCTQCRHYDEEKIQRVPERVLDEEAYREFLEECRRFDEWLEDHEGRILEVGGRVSDIRPHLIRQVDGHRSSLFLRGFLVRLVRAFVGRDGLEDALYLRLGKQQQNRHRIGVGDEIEALGRVVLDRGRLVAEGARRLRVEERGGQPAARWDRALLDREGAVALSEQHGRCLRCERGVLVDVEDASGRRLSRRREMLCLEGIGRPGDCPYEALKLARWTPGRIPPR